MDKDSWDSRTAPQGAQDASPDFVRSQGGLGFIRHLWNGYPLVVWSALWALMLVLAAIAMSGLLNPDLSQPIHAARTPDLSRDPAMLDDPIVGQAVPPRVETAPPQEDSPLWPLTLLLMACGLGCWAFSLQLKRHPSQTWQSVADPLADGILDGSREERPGAIAPYQPVSLEPSDRPHLTPTPADAVAASSPAAMEPPAVPPSLPAASRPSFEMPQQSRLRELDRRAPGLAELLDIQRRREQRPMGRSHDRQDP